MTLVDLLASAAGVLLSLLFAYVPGLSGWFEKLEPTYKRLVMLGLLVLVAAGSLGAACAGWAEPLGITVICSKVGALELLRALLYAAMANQTAFMLSPKPAGKIANIANTGEVQ